MQNLQNRFNPKACIKQKSIWPLLFICCAVISLNLLRGRLINTAGTSFHWRIEDLWISVFATISSIGLLMCIGFFIYIGLCKACLDITDGSQVCSMKFTFGVLQYMGQISCKKPFKLSSLFNRSLFRSNKSQGTVLCEKSENWTKICLWVHLLCFSS